MVKGSTSDPNGVHRSNSVKGDDTAEHPYANQGATNAKARPAGPKNPASPELAGSANSRKNKRPKVVGPALTNEGFIG